MITTIIIFAVTYLFIASEKIDKTIAALLGASAVIFLHAIPSDKLEGKHDIFEALKEKIDIEVIFLLVGMMLIVYILSITGIFEWIAITIAQKSKGNGLLIFVLFMIATAVLSAFLDNVTTIILMAPITILITQILEIPTSPILIMEAIFSNIGGTATLVGDPPNILIASKAKLQFNEFLIYLGPVVLVIMAVSIIAVIFVFKTQLEVSESLKQRIMKAKPEKAITEPAILKKAGFIFALVIAGFFCSRLLGVNPGVTALAGGMIMALVCKVDMHKALNQVEWNTIFFFIGLFMLIGALEVSGLFELIGEHVISMTQGNLMLTAIVILWFSAIFSAIVDNIPLVMAMIPLIQYIVPLFAKEMNLEAHPELIRASIEAPLFWSLSLGACLGGNGSLIGASANVVVAQVAKRNNYKLSFMDFTKYGFPIMILSLIISTGYIYLRFFS